MTESLGHILSGRDAADIGPLLMCDETGSVSDLVTESGSDSDLVRPSPVHSGRDAADISPLLTRAKPGQDPVADW